MIIDKDIPSKIEQLELNDKKTGVQSSWLPDSFEWITPVRGKSLEVGKIISIKKNGIKLTAITVEEAGITAKDKLAVGYNKSFIAFRKDEKGFQLKASQSKKSSALTITSKNLIEALTALGFKTGTTHDITWDQKSKMLVVKIPKVEHKSSVVQPKKEV